MTFKLSQRSLDKLDGVDEKLVATVKLAIAVAKIDFGVICGLRTMEEQRVLVDKGASKTMRSKHLDGKAVDLMAYIGSRGSWELNLYDDIADAMKEAAVETGRCCAGVPRGTSTTFATGWNDGRGDERICGSAS
jgi:peptidoglycan LD-endopeptidase CwlK